MKISTKGRYSLNVMIDLALNQEEGKYISIKDISERQGISIKYLEKLVSVLNKAGYIQSSRGNNGGYKLAKEPKEYKVGEILRIAEGSLKPLDCIDQECGRREKCRTYTFWQGLDKVIEEYVDSKTLEDLIK